MDLKINTIKILLSILFIGIAHSSFSFQNSDSLAYQLQRKKINDMLDAKSAKFGQYGQSLSKRTGIFGLKTKKDMQRSMDILRQIIDTDNAILRETKTLLDFKTYQQEKVQSQSQESESRNMGYMRTINKLQAENEKLNNKLADSKKNRRFYQLFTFALGLSILGLGLFIYRKISIK